MKTYKWLFPVFVMALTLALAGGAVFSTNATARCVVAQPSAHARTSGSSVSTHPDYEAGLPSFLTCPFCRG